MVRDQTTAAGDAEKSPWNSLEAAKLLVGSLTTLGVVVLGYLITVSTSREQRENDKAIRAEAAENARKDRNDAIARARDAEIEQHRREEHNRVRAEQLAKEARDEAFARELALQDRAAVREIAARNHAELREQRLRREAAEQAQSARIYAERLQIWNKATPRLATLMSHFDRYDLLFRRREPFPPQLVESTREQINALRSDVLAYSEYFGEGFRPALEAFITAADLVAWGAEQGLQPLTNDARSKYRSLIERARPDLTP